MSAWGLRGVWAHATTSPSVHPHCSSDLPSQDPPGYGWSFSLGTHGGGKHGPHIHTQHYRSWSCYNDTPRLFYSTPHSGFILSECLCWTREATGGSDQTRRGLSPCHDAPHKLGMLHLSITRGSQQWSQSGTWVPAVPSLPVDKQSLILS